MKKRNALIVVCMLLAAGCFSSAAAQKLPVGSKGFESLSRSIFMKEGGYSTHFPKFYKNLSSSLGKQMLSRSELRELTRIYLHSQVPVQSAYNMMQSKAQAHAPAALHLPSDVAFISLDNINAVSRAVWKRDNLGTDQELQKLQQVLVKSLSKYPSVQLTLKEFYYIVSKYTFEGPNFIKGFLETLPKRQVLTRVQLSKKGQAPLDVFVYQDQVSKAVQLYYAGKPFQVEKGNVVEK